MSSLASQVITWLLVLLGWTIVNAQNNRREERKELRAALDRLSLRIEKLVVLSIKYWQSEVSSESDDTSWEIKRDLDNVEASINRIVRRSEMSLPWYWLRRSERLRAISVANSNVLTAFDEWAGTLTGGDFESAARVSRSIADDLITTNVLRANGVVDCLEAAHEAFYGAIGTRYVHIRA